MLRDRHEAAAVRELVRRRERANRCAATGSPGPGSARVAAAAASAGSPYASAAADPSVAAAAAAATPGATTATSTSTAGAAVRGRAPWPPVATPPTPPRGTSEPPPSTGDEPPEPHAATATVARESASQFCRPGSDEVVSSRSSRARRYHDVLTTFAGGGHRPEASHRECRRRGKPWLSGVPGRMYAAFA